MGQWRPPRAPLDQGIVNSVEIQIKLIQKVTILQNRFNDNPKTPFDSSPDLGLHRGCYNKNGRRSSVVHCWVFVYKPFVQAAVLCGRNLVPSPPPKQNEGATSQTYPHNVHARGFGPHRRSFRLFNSEKTQRCYQKRCFQILTNLEHTLYGPQRYTPPPPRGGSRAPPDPPRSSWGGSAPPDPPDLASGQNPESK